MIPELCIEPLANTREIPFEILELADPSRTQVDSYLKNGTCYLAKIDAVIVGVMILKKIIPATMEIKNIAVRESQQGKGIGKALLRYSEKVSRESGYKNLVIGTGNSSIGQLALYQKEGFEIDRIEMNFFIKNYPEPIFENGIQCKHKVILQKILKD